MDYYKLDRSKFTALIFAAGFGSRLGVLTEKTPKPLIEISGITLLERAFTHLNHAGIKQVIINTHYLANKMNEALPLIAGKFPDIRTFVMHEEEILGTGGTLKDIGIKTGLDSILTFNCDSLIWGHNQPLAKIISLWSKSSMDAIIYLKTKHSMLKGDFDIVNSYPLGHLGIYEKHFQYIGIGIYNLNCIKSVNLNKFCVMKDYIIANISNNQDNNKKTNYYGVMMDGFHLDVGTISSLELANKNFIDKSLDLFENSLQMRNL